ncbi:hypothetical protein [Nocardia sp. CC201C]|uniref:hypothetical protein n=1 Tax=Nocardia sp. CC201C TaxID=3044575 RepID=UPI0024A862A2|nr:hypothetical protein [Nocardia sp. CC201C]
MRSKLSTRAAAVAVGAATLLTAGLGGMAVAAAHPAELSPGPNVTVQRDGERVVIDREGNRVPLPLDGEGVIVQRDGDKVIIKRQGAPDVVGVPALPAVPGMVAPTAPLTTAPSTGSAG